MESQTPVFIFTEEERAAAVKIGAAGDELERRAERLTAKLKKALERNDQARVQRIMRQWHSLAADADCVKDGMIKQYFKSASSWLEGIGEDIIQGLWNGAKSVWSQVSSWLGSIKNDIDDVLGDVGLHGSPSPYMITVGQDMMQGLQIGLTDGTGGVLSKLQSISRTITGGGVGLGAQSLVPSAAMPLAGGGTAGGTVINMTVTGNTIMNQNDVNQLTSRISNHLARYIIPSSGLRPVAP